MVTIELQDHALTVDKFSCKESADEDAKPQPAKRARHGGSCDLVTVTQAVPDFAGNLVVYLWESSEGSPRNYRLNVHADVRSLLTIGKDAQLQFIVGIKNARASQVSDDAMVNLYMLCEQLRQALPEAWRKSRRLRLASTTETDRRFVLQWLRYLSDDK